MLAPHSSQGTRLAVSGFLLFQTGAVTLVEPPLSMSPQSRYLILLPPLLLAEGVGGQRKSSVWGCTVGTALLLKKAWFPWEPVC